MGYGRLDGCGNCIKYGMFITNFIIFLGGIILVALGIWTLVDKSFANELLGTNLYAGAVYVIIATGALVLLISCFGCFGSIKEVRCLLVAYFIAVFIIFVTMLVGGILGYVFRGKVETTLENAMYASIRSYGNYEHPAVTQSWDETQRRLMCCGVRGPHDWSDHIPDSCCRESVPGRSQRCQIVVQQNALIMYKDGCLFVTKRFVKDHAVIIGSAGVVVACLMKLGTDMGNCMLGKCKHLDKQYINKLEYRLPIYQTNHNIGPVQLAHWQVTAMLGMIFSCALYKKIDD